MYINVQSSNIEVFKHSCFFYSFDHERMMNNLKFFKFKFEKKINVRASRLHFYFTPRKKATDQTRARHVGEKKYIHMYIFLCEQCSA